MEEVYFLVLTNAFEKAQCLKSRKRPIKFSA